jgi:hypothetical protein
MTWDFSEGAHGDGTGIVYNLEVAYLFKKIIISKPKKNTLHFFLCSRNGTRGAKARCTPQNEQRSIQG